MARTGFDSGSAGPGNEQEILKFQADGQDRIELPSSDFISDAKMTRDGDDLVLQAPNGETVVIEGYFNADPAPLLQSADGATLTPNLVEAFSRSPMEFAANGSANDESPVGAVEEVKGTATVTRADGTVETITIGTPIYQGDVIETDASGAVNIVFIDETSMAISQNARLAIDEYTFDPATESGTTNFSVLRGLFVFTSGLIGRDDPDDVSIDTPVGSIGIRGTVIAGEINPSGESKITVLEGAIVVKNGAMETVLSEQFETVSLHGFDAPMKDLGVVPASDIGARFSSIGDVNPGLFTTINDAVKEQSTDQQPSQQDSKLSSPSGEEQDSQPQSQQQNTTQETAPVAELSQPDAPAPAPEAPAPAPVVSDIITLSGDTSALPSMETATGQPSGGLAGSSGTTTTTTAGTSSSTAAAPVVTAPVTTQPTTSVTGLDTSVIDTTTQQPPPSVIAQPNTPTTPVTPTPTTGFTLAFAGGSFNDLTTTGTVIGNMSYSTTSGVTVTYSISSPNNYFTIDSSTGAVTLTTAGATLLGQNLDVVQLGGFTITATSSTGEVVTSNYNTTVTDAHTASQTINLDGTLSGRQVAIISDTINNKIGYTITALGDTNNDGFDDFAFSNDTTLAGQNHSYKIHGGAMLASADLPSIPPIILQNNTNTGTFAATSIAGIGDFNGDGVEDYIVGQPNNNSTMAGSGAASVISGANNAQFIGVNSATGVPAGSEFGKSVDGVGDFNNDGYADVIIGAPGADDAYYLSGRPGMTGSIIGQSVALSFTNGDGFGTSVAGIGDFNGDGYSDFAVGAPSSNGNNGAAYIYTGNNGNPAAHLVISGSAGQALGQEISYAGDINGDGYSDMLIGGDGNVGRIQFGAGSGTGSSVELNIPGANYTVTGAGGVGDFNGDGFDDFAIAVADGNSTNMYVIYGKDSWGAGITLADLKNPQFALEMTYSRANSASDIEIGRIGDINGDGYEDFAMGLPDANGTAAGNGGLAIVYGRDTGAVRAGSSVATQDGDSLVGMATMSDGLNDDVSMTGNHLANFFEISNTDFRKIDGGGSPIGQVDTIVTRDSLDFSDVNFEKISNIEQMLIGADNQTLTLTMENLFNLMKTSDTGDLMIGRTSEFFLNTTLVLTDGNGTDNYTGATNGTTEIASLINTYNGGNATMSTETVGSTDYNVFNIGGYKLMIDQAITVDAQ